MSVNDMTGTELAAKLLQGVGHEHVRAATRLLGSHRGGFWLRRFAEDEELAQMADRLLIDATDGIDWEALTRLMRTPG
ncbi:hypothetical protein [Streptomyces sp. MJM1172]|uniref:hypothetical protein n=1 Tax=Streptomyces sp. MJM1172 TaxID=1703926 RepID=UPI0011612034|nr:hypothetical protein [Streptomyces sp. MJM1172]